MLFSYKKNKIYLFRWLKRLIYLWVRSTAFPKTAKEAINLAPEASTCYILKEKSFLDLLILDYHCCKEGLPRPIYQLKQLTENICASHIYLKKQSIISEHPTRSDYENIYKLLDRNLDSQIPIQVIPVSIFWGRNPGRREKSLFKLLFLDNDNRNFFQRFFSFFAHGRRVCCCFGQTIVLDKVSQRQDLDAHAQKLKKTLRNHFHEKRIAVLGPQIYNRNHVMRNVLQSPQVKSAIEKESLHKKVDPAKTKRMAFRYINEIAANLSFNMMRFYNIFLTWLCNRLYKKVKVYNFEKNSPLNRTQ